jgi:hypothetical protein
MNSTAAGVFTAIEPLTSTLTQIKYKFGRVTYILFLLRVRDC